MHKRFCSYQYLVFKVLIPGKRGRLFIFSKIKRPTQHIAIAKTELIQNSSRRHNWRRKEILLAKKRQRNHKVHSMDGRKATFSSFGTHQIKQLNLDRLENPTTIQEIEKAAKRANEQKKSEKHEKESEKQGKESENQEKQSLTKTGERVWKPGKRVWKTRERSLTNKRRRLANKERNKDPQLRREWSTTS